jgi:glycosyltransferase involved in cell wall biosynthesis
VADGLGSSGVTFDGTASDLEARLDLLLSLPQATRREMGLAARAAVVERWSWEGIASRLVEISLG